MAKKFLVPIDLNQNELRNAVVQNLGADPGSLVNGQLWYLTTGSHDVRARVNGVSVSLLPTSLLGSANTWTAANVFNGAITGNNTINLTGAGASSVAGTLAATAHVASGLTGAVAASRYVGATASGAPASGTFAVGDFVIAQNGAIWICTAGGTPGTWVNAGASGNLVTSVAGRTGAVTLTAADVGAGTFPGANTFSGAQTFSGGITANSAVTGNGTVNLTGAGASSVGGTFTGTAIVASGLTGSVAASRYVGATASGAPASGAHLVGDFVVTQDAHVFICTVAGTPGTWVDVALAGSLTLSGTVTGSTSYGQASNAGSATTASRGDHVHGTPTHVTGDHSGFSLSIFAAPTADLSIGSHKLTNVLDPTGAQDAATKNYVDAARSGLSIKDPVRVMATTNITVASPGATIDGVTMAVNDRVLLGGQTTGSENGIYVWNGAAVAMTRATDADTSAEVPPGTAVWVNEGTANGDSRWVLTTNAPITLGTTALTFTQDFRATSTTAGAGLTATGSVLAVGAGTGISVAADSVGIDTTVVARKVSQLIGTGAATSIAVTHNLGNQWVNAQVFNAASPFDEQECDVQLTDANTVTFLFTTAPASNALRAVITG